MRKFVSNYWKKNINEKRPGESKKKRKNLKPESAWKRNYQRKNKKRN